MPERSMREFERRQAQIRAEREAVRSEKMLRAKLYAQRVVRTFNACCRRGKVPAFFPTIRCCIVAEQTKLETICDGCVMITHSHIDKFEHHPLATIATLLVRIRCVRCGDNAPIARVQGISDWNYHPAHLNPLRNWKRSPMRPSGRG